MRNISPDEIVSIDTNNYYVPDIRGGMHLNMETRNSLQQPENKSNPKTSTFQPQPDPYHRTLGEHHKHHRTYTPINPNMPIQTYNTLS